MSSLLNPQGVVLDSQALFESYLSSREHDRYDPLSRAAAQPYRYIWQAWCRWLAERYHDTNPALYRQAIENDAYQYLREGPSPASKRKTRTAAISAITRQRYGRVLREVYQHAVDFGYAESSPISERAMGQPPTVSERTGQILPPGVLQAVPAVLASDPTPYQMRDNAILMLLLDTAMTSSELRELTMDDVTKNFEDAGQYWLRIDGPRGAQNRTISTRGPVGYALARWLSFRKHLERPTDAVFVSEKKGPMQRETMFRLIARVIGQACQHVGAEVPNHVGPATLRNAVIVHWLNLGASPTEVCQRTGIQDERTLLVRLKRHLHLGSRSPAAVVASAPE